MGSQIDFPQSLLERLRCGAASWLSSFSVALRPDPEVTVSVWADEHRVLTNVASSEPGRWRTGRTPYLREIMDTLSPSHPASEVVFMKGTQIGGSEAGYNWLGAIIDLWPAPTMLVMPTSEVAKRTSKQRLAPMIAASPRLRDKVSESRSRDSGNTLLMKEFDGGVLVLAGANSGPGLRSMPVRFLMMDEVDAYPVDVGGEGDPVVVARKRTETFARRKVFVVSSPKMAQTSRIARAYEESDQRRYVVPCPHCGHEQWLRWAQMRWETRKVWERVDTSTGEQLTCADGEDGAAERDTGDVQDVWYECESCGGRIGEQHKGQMLAAGRWVAARPGAGRAAGFHLSALYSPPGWFAWRQAVVQFLESQKDPGGELAQVFANTVLAEPWDEGGDQVDASVLEDRIDADRRPGSPVPRGGLILTAGVDVQHDRLEARVWAWGRGEESWLVAREIIFGGPSDEATWAALEELLFRAWPHAGGAALKVSATAIDAGDGNTTHWVRQFCRKWSHRHVLACKGQAAAGKAILGRPTDQDVSHKGKLLRGAVKMWPIGSDTAKAVLYARYEVEDGPGRVHLLAGLPGDELEQMTSERCVTRFVRGYPRREWTKPASARNEALDCFVLALAAAHYAGVTRCNWDRLEAVLMQPDLLAGGAEIERAADQTARADAPASMARATRAAGPSRPPARAAFSTRW